MKRRAFVLSGFSLLAFAGCSKKVRFSSIPAGSTVLAFGDSVTYGTGAAVGEDWPGLLAALTGWQVINAGVPGDTAEAGKSRIQAVLDEHKPSLVIIEIGGNDFLRRRPAKMVKEDIRQLIGLARQAGAQVVLVGVPELSLLAVVAGQPSDSPIYKELAQEEKLPVIGDVFSNILASPALCADKIHPNAQGYIAMANGIHAALHTLGIAP